MTQSHTVQTKHFKLKTILKSHPHPHPYTKISNFQSPHGGVALHQKAEATLWPSHPRGDTAPACPPPSSVTTPEKVIGLSASLRGNTGQRKAGQGTHGPAGLELRTREG